jgi:hypothetical protein
VCLCEIALLAFKERSEISGLKRHQQRA